MSGRSNPVADAALSVFVSAAVSAACVALGVLVLGRYGWGLFVALPFFLGFFAVLMYNRRQDRGVGGSVAVAAVASIAPAVPLILLRQEGLICLAMAAPLAVPLGILGGLCAYLIVRRRWPRPSPSILCLLALALPGSVMWAEGKLDPPAPRFAVTSAVEIDAPPESVWKHVVEFSQLPEPTESLFHTGIAYPIRADLLGTGVGATRLCWFTTGAFVEPITVWDEPRLLRFRVTHTPPPLEEWNPLGKIHPPHLDGYFVSRQGQFRLIALAGGRTRLEGTSWYEHTIWPASYWRLWSDFIIHRIHMRVLRYIKEEVERG